MLDGWDFSSDADYLICKQSMLALHVGDADCVVLTIICIHPLNEPLASQLLSYLLYLGISIHNYIYIMYIIVLFL